MVTSIRLFTVFTLMLVALVCRGQQDMRGVAIEFRAGKATIDTTFRNNAQGVRQLRQLAADVARDSNYRLTSLTLGGYASPEGSYQLNKRLARQRCDALRALIDEQLSVPDSIVRYTMDSYIPWDQMEMMVRNSNIEDKDSIIAALRADSTMVRYGNSATIDGRAKAIERSRGTDAWHRLQRAIFPRMRLATAVFITRRITPAPEVGRLATRPAMSFDTLPEPEPVPEPEPILEPEPEPEPAPVVEPLDSDTLQNIFVKTNLVGWGLIMTNIAAEYQWNDRWSVTLPLYYSAWNYFKGTRKYRTFVVQPEIRYWFNEHVYAGVHLGLAYYNYAKDGEWRYQDHNGSTPALGGGIGGGWRTALSKDRHWWLELTAGIGVYRLHYDVFHNYHNGLVVDERRRTFFGVDNVAVTIAYRFDIKRNRR